MCCCTLIICISVVKFDCLLVSCQQGGLHCQAWCDRVLAGSDQQASRPHRFHKAHRRSEWTCRVPAPCGRRLGLPAPVAVMTTCLAKSIGRVTSRRLPFSTCGFAGIKLPHCHACRGEKWLSRIITLSTCLKKHNYNSCLPLQFHFVLHYCWKSDRVFAHYWFSFRKSKW